MNLSLFDAHCHLQARYAPTAKEVLARMEERRVGGLVVGTDYEMSKEALELAHTHPYLWAAVGLHPNDPGTFDASAFEALAQDKRVAAIGECGLDYFRSEKSDAQKERFLQHVALAEKVGKPLIIHCRDAHDEMLALLREQQPSVPVVMHFFTGSGALAEEYLSLGCYLSFPGPITYTDMYDDSIRVCPVERMLIETDSPFAAPVPFRGKKNEPVFVEHVAEKIAQVKGLSKEEVEAATLNNAVSLFKLEVQ